MGPYGNTGSCSHGRQYAALTYFKYISGAAAGYVDRLDFHL